ncbi:MAG: methyltransferase [Anaerolineae bacterium]|nr:methyltransferase [Anaerolineae bacterium]
MNIIVSHIQTHPLIKAREAGQFAMEFSPDLGLSTMTVHLSPDGVDFSTGERLPWHAVEEVNANENNCFVVEGDALRKVVAFSEYTNRVYSLMPTRSAPTMLISGIPMHRIKDTDPYRDTLEKIKAARPVGEVLDTATGLGYTAIEAAKTAHHVTTIELDPVALDIAQDNPWSRALFDNPKITQCIGDSYDVIETLDDTYFTRIIHDPPMYNLAPHLYSSDFYMELYRVLRGSGRMFHYIGNPESKSGRSVTRGVIQRLLAVGFSQVKHYAQAFGVVAFK